MALLPEDQKLLDDVLAGTNVDAETVNEIKSMLLREVSAMSDTIPMPLGTDALGQSSSAGRLATNAGMASDAIIEEMTKMVAGLRAYRVNISLWAQDFEAADEGAAQVLTGFQEAASCVASRSYDDGCTLPTGGDR